MAARSPRVLCDVLWLVTHACFLSSQDEVAGIALACDEFLAASSELAQDARSDDPATSSTAEACRELQRIAAMLQATTDEEMGLLHGLVAA